MSRLLELDAYLTGELADGPTLDAFEEALFDAPDDPDLAFVELLARRGSVLVHDGTFGMGVLRADVEALRARGESLAFAEIGPPGAYDIVFPRDGRIVCTSLELGRTDLERVDVEMRLVDHDNAMKTLRDVVVDPSDGKIYALCERPLFELTLAAGRVHAKVFRRDGARELIAEWQVNGSLAPL